MTVTLTHRFITAEEYQWMVLRQAAELLRDVDFTAKRGGISFETSCPNPQQRQGAEPG